MENLGETEHVAGLGTPMRPASLETEKSIVVIDTSRLARAGLVNLLQIMGYDRVHEADDMTALNIQDQDRSNLKVIVIRISTYDVNPKEVMEQILRTMPDVRVLFLAPYLDIKL